VVDESESEAIEERTVILTEAGIDILNFTYLYAIPPLLKPKISSPLERPIHYFDNNRGMFRQFDKTYRYGSFLNTTSSVDHQTLHYCHINGADMEKKREQSHREGTLRYKQPFKASESTIRARGLSFRGRGLLDIRKGWEKEGEYFENGITGDITDTSYKAESAPISFIDELGHPLKPQFTATPQTPVHQVTSLGTTPLITSPTPGQPPTLLEIVSQPNPILQTSLTQKSPHTHGNLEETPMPAPPSADQQSIKRQSANGETDSVRSIKLRMSSICLLNIFYRSIDQF
jgi:hypothetical protein